MNCLVHLPLLACLVIAAAEAATLHGFAARSSGLNQIKNVLLKDWVVGHGHPRSNVTVKESFAIPNSQGWCQCSDCGLRADGEIAVFSPVNQNVFTRRTLVSWSLWGEFFHENRNDRYHAKSAAMGDFNRRYYVERPVFVLPMITLHVGHVLIDVLEQLYHTHMQLYGTIRRDCLIILDVASGEERAVLDEKIRLAINSEEGNPAMLLRQFTDLPVFGIELWNELRSLDSVVFKDLHIGLDISKTFFNAGQRTQPCIASLTHGNVEVLASAQRYREFSRFISNTGRLFTKSHEVPPSRTMHPHVFVDQRSTNRVILNIQALQDALNTATLSSAIQSLDDISFRNQLELFRNIDILVAVAGTALHNVLFMRPGSAVILFMQPEWCEQAWMYANQAALLGIAPFVHCVPSTSPVAPARTEGSSKAVSVHDPAVFKHFQWSRQFWLQGPRHHKTQNISVDPAVFARLLQNASEYVEANRENANKSFDSVKILQEERNLDPLVCPGYTPSFQKTPPIAVKETLSAQVKPPSQAQGPVVHRIVEMYISSIDVNFEGGIWKVALTGEIGAARGDLGAMLRSMPHLTFCMESTDVSAWCYPVAGFNYYTSLNLDMARPLQSLHFWAQVSTMGGKIRHSDVFVSLDCRQPQAGLDLHHQVIGLDAHFEVDVLHDCTDPVEGQRYDQVLRYLSHKFYAPRLTCASSKWAVFQHTMVSRLSLQRFTADFCFAHELNGFNCADFVFELQEHLRRVLKGNQLKLPAVQGRPKGNNPFFFMHLEKTAGTTIREYIYESLPSPNSTALIPCYTTHCTVSVIPKHKPQAQEASARELGETQTVESAVSGDSAGDWGQWSDLRLIQPSARDISNLTVIAGHFNFYAVHQALPQCQDAVPGTLCEPAGESPWSSHILTRVDPNHPVVPPTPVSTPQCHVSCFVMGRHPVSRAISYYYQRVYKHPNKSALPRSESAEAAQFGGRPLEQRMINELTPQQLELIALSTREGIESHLFPGRQVFIDEGMTDAACHAFLGLKYTTGLPVGPLTVPPAIPPELYPQAIQNLRQCVVGMQEQWNDTLRVLDHWYPWIDFSVDPARRKMSIFKGIETLTSLRPDLYNVLTAINPCDMMLHDEMIRLFRAQLSVLEA